MRDQVYQGLTDNLSSFYTELNTFNRIHRRGGRNKIKLITFSKADYVSYR